MSAENVSVEKIVQHYTESYHFEIRSFIAVASITKSKTKQNRNDTKKRKRNTNKFTYNYYEKLCLIII